MRTAFLFLAIGLHMALNLRAQSNLPPAPVAQKIPYTIHGAFGDRQDDYFWMKDRGNKQVLTYLKAENSYLDAVMAHTQKFQDTLFQELKGRVKEDASTVPVWYKGFYYYERYVPDGEYPVYCRKKGSLDAQEEIIIDGNALGAKEEFLEFYVQMSPDQNMAAVVMDVHGRNFFTIRIKDLRTGKWLQDVIHDTRNGCEWTSDNSTIVYSVPDKETLRVYQVKKHVLGTAEKNDPVLLQENDPTLDIYLYTSRSEKYILIDAERTDANVVYYTDASHPDTCTAVVPLEANIYYTVDHAEGDHFLIRTNYNAVNYRLVKAPVASHSKSDWTDVIPHREHVFLDEVELFKDFIVAEETENGLQRIRVIDKQNKSRDIAFEEAAYWINLDENPDFNSKEIRYQYASLITPFSTYAYNMETGTSTLLKQQEIPSGYDKSQYATERILVPARDGKLIPMAIVYKKDVYRKDGSAPGFIYGYGAYGYSNEDYFDTNILSLLDRGFVYANTHVRGGEEMGGDWYEDGKMLHKKNTFFDFIDCSQYLIDNGYVAKDKLFANGGSAGGLLMGAVTNMRPDLYRGVIADVPFVDVITTMEDESIPLTTFEWLEWGNPKIKEQYDYMMSYSPYDNVEVKAYPNLLVTTGWNDSQVQYHEPAKYVAKLRAMKTDDNLLLFKINMGAGHGGNSGRYESLKEIALMYAFIFECLDRN
ncbi:MAG: S9 family peptidase [Chitinophagales bacterium]